MKKKTIIKTKKKEVQRQSLIDRTWGSEEISRQLV
jgi:hypothetical protein